MYRAIGSCTVEDHCRPTCQFIFFETLRAESYSVIACDNMVANYDCMLDVGMALKVKNE